MNQKNIVSPGQHKMAFEKDVVIKAKLNYLLYLPPGYEQSGDEKWPLMIFLHGIGERGTDVEKVKMHGPPKVLAEGMELPMIVLSPQCPPDDYWPTDSLLPLIDQIIADYNVDEDRVYLTGLSMGGFGTWRLAADNPNKFAAVVPICGGGESFKAVLLKHVPIWVFHGAKDTVVPISYSEAMVDRLKSVGGNVKFTIYPNAGHDSWTKTYNNPELYEWMLQQRRPDSD